MKNQSGFDWRNAIKLLERSAKRHGYKTLVVTDCVTKIDRPWLRVGNAKEQGLMMWLLSAQAEAIRESGTSAVMVSPDSLISKPIDFLIGDHDLTLLTRLKPKPIVNSIIAFKPSLKLFTMWLEIVQAANNLPT